MFYLEILCERCGGGEGELAGYNPSLIGKAAAIERKEPNYERVVTPRGLEPRSSA